MKNKIIAALFFLVISMGKATAQKNIRPDSLINEISLCRTDTCRLNLYIKVVTIYYTRSLWDSAMIYTNEGLKLAKLSGNVKREADFYQWIGVLYHFRSYYQLALENYLKSLALHSSIDNKKGMASCVNNVGGIYFDELNDYPRALEYFRQSVKIKNELGDEKSMAIGYANLGNCYIEIKDYPQALENLLLARKKQETLNDSFELARTYNFLGNYYTLQKNYPEALKYRLSALAIGKSQEVNSVELGSLTGIAQVYRSTGEYQVALGYYRQALPLAKQMEYDLGELNIYEGLFKLFAGSRHFDSAYFYLQLHTALRDSVRKREFNNKIAEMQVIYETEKKEKEIVKLASDKAKSDLMLSRKRAQLIFAASSFLLLLAGLTIVYTRYRQRQYKKLTGKEIELQALQKKQQEEMLQAIVKTQEEERHKLSNNLHDGLGQMLTAARINLSLCTDELKTASPGSPLLKNISMATEMVQKALGESRQIAFDLLPINISESGLINGIREICEYNNSVNRGLKIDFYASGNPEPFPAFTMIHLFRICQELITNVIKHAGATQADLQLFYRDETLVIQMVDNGKGFDSSLPDIHGLGLKSISNRVKQLEGNLEIDTNPGKGTTVTIHIPLKKTDPYD